MKRRALAVLAVVLLIAADAKDDAAQSELNRLQGTWKVVSLVRNGQEFQPEDSSSTVSGNKFTTKSQGKVIREGTLKVYPSAKPRATDATYATGPDKGKTLKGIYVLEDDTWKICYAAAGEERPKAFPEKPGEGHLVLVLKRVKAR